jgi:two-component system response regulator YesN
MASNNNEVNQGFVQAVEGGVLLYKLLITDDESRIRRGIKNLINWKELNIEVVGEAEDGEIALEIAKEKLPDIILLDICMPFLNGLQLIKRLKEEACSPVIIIITGHDEFKYVQEALKLRVFDYILKPVMKDDLTRSIARALEELDRKNSESLLNEWMSKKLVDGIETVKETLLNSWLKGLITLQQVKSELDFINIGMEGDIGLLLVKPIGLLNTELLSKKMDERLLGFAVKNIIEEMLKPFSPFLIGIDEDGAFAAVCSITKSSEWINLSMEIEKSIVKYLDYKVIAEQKKVLQGLEGVCNTYKELQEELGNKLQYKPVVLLALKYIDSNYFNQDLNLETVAAELNVSSSYLSKLMKEEIGMSFIDYLTHVKIQKAIFLMEDPTIKIHEVAELVGYNDQHYFCKAFKRTMGYPPIEYRERNKKKPYVV